MAVGDFTMNIRNKTSALLGLCLLTLLFMPADLCIPPAYATQVLASQNLIQNGSFEEAAGRSPEQWRRNTWGGRAELAIAESGHTGSKSVTISSEEGADASWGTTLPVRPYSRYRLSGWIKTDKLVATTGRGALLNLHAVDGAWTRSLTGTQDWTEVEFSFDTESSDAIQVNCLFGGWGNATGQAWFDDIKLELLSTQELKPTVTIDAGKTGAPISKYIYGQFIEHLGRCIYGGIWAEMLEDRKFYYAIGARQSPWDVVGPAGAVSMVQEDSFVGEHTPHIQLSGDGAPAGIAQNNLGLIQGREYIGRIILAGDSAAAPLELSLVWGDGIRERETITIRQLGAQYVNTPLHFTAGAATDQGRLEIVGRGKGVFQVGTVSLMPDDNVKGMRADTLKLLKELNSPVYRWPGGNFVSGYDWRDGVGDRDRRPPRKNPAWRGVEHNDFGLHEFMTFCRELNTEPYIAVNTGLGKVEGVALEVEYCNGSLSTPMGRWRAANGDPEPFAVKWWAVGNEMYGGWQLGNMPLTEYVIKHNQCAEAMRAVDPAIQLVAVGSVGEWSRQTLTDCVEHLDLISEHFYVQEAPGLLAHVSLAPRAVKRIADAHRQYRRTLPSLAGKDIRIALDEWNYWYGPHVYGELGTRYFLKDALGIAAGLHEYYRNSDIIFMANYAQTVNVIGCIKTSKTAAEFATTGQVLKLYRNHYGVTPVEVGGKPEPLDVAAAWTADRKAITIAIVNPTQGQIDLPVELKGVELTGKGQSWLITGPDALAYNEPGKEPVVFIAEKVVENFSDKLTAPPLSAVLYKLKVK
jgi:alpha-N-arabinofuranosidase